MDTEKILKDALDSFFRNYDKYDGSLFKFCKAKRFNYKQLLEFEIEYLENDEDLKPKRKYIKKQQIKTKKIKAPECLLNNIYEHSIKIEITI